MLNMIKKDLLMFWRDRRETTLAVILPIFLIVVLNFAFANVFGADSKTVSLKLAIVNEDDEAEGMRQFEDQVLAMGWPAAETEEILAQASQLSPIPLIYGYLQSPELSEWLSVHHLSESEAKQQVEQEDVDGMIHIPAGYTVSMLNAIILGEDSAVPLPFVVNENTLQVSILGGIIYDFFDQINFHLALQNAAGDAMILGSAPIPEGGRETIAGSDPFTMGQYFTIAMAVLFALFLAVTAAEKTGAEKREQVFNRIIISNTRPLKFLAGKIYSTFCLVFLQFMFIVLVSQLMLGVFSGKSLTFWLGLLAVVLFYTLFIASLSALYTSVVLRLSNIDAANGIFLLITMVFGTIGGSFVPLYIFPAWLQRIGEYSPNGFTLAALTEWIQFEQLSTLSALFLALGIASIACFIAGAALYPRRGEV